VFLAEQLAMGEGLCLNVKKTRIQPAHEFKAHLENQLVDPDTEAEQSAIETLSHTIYFEETPSQEDIDRLRAMNLLEMLEEEIAQDDWDFGRIKSILLGLRLTSDEDAVDAVAIHLKVLLPFMKEIVLLVDQIRKEGKDISDQLEDKAKELLNSSVVDRLPLVKLWLLEFFVRGCLHISSSELNKIRFDDPITLRESLLIRGLNGEVNYFRRQKTRFDQWNRFEQPYVLLGATCLPRDEFQTWVSAIRTSMDRPLDGLFCAWVRDKQGQLEAIIARRPARA
jgi:hypothetical protein